MHEVIFSFCQETKNWLQLLFLYDLAFYESASTRAAARFSNPGGLAVMRWAESAPLVVIGLTELPTELPNSGWAKAHPAHPLAAALSTVGQNFI